MIISDLAAAVNDFDRWIENLSASQQIGLHIFQIIDTLLGHADRRERLVDFSLALFTFRGFIYLGQLFLDAITGLSQ